MKLPPKLPDHPFTYRQAEALGFSGKRLSELVANRRVIRILQGVYQPASLPDTFENRCKAAALVMPPFGVLCDRSAAWLHGVDTFEYRELEILPALELFVLRDNSRTRRWGCRGGERDLAPEDIGEYEGISVTTPLRTALDLGCKLGPRDGLAALDGFMRNCDVTRDELERQLPRFRRRRGVVQLRRLVPLATPLAESSGESWTRMAIIQAGLPVPQPQFWVVFHGVKLFRLDLAYPSCKIAIEYDGKEFHDPIVRRQADEERRSWLRDHGWTVIVVKSDSFKPDSLDLWTSQLAVALRVASR